MLYPLITSHLGTFVTTISLSVAVGCTPRKQLWHFHAPEHPIVTGLLFHNRLRTHESCNIYPTTLLYQSLNTIADCSIDLMLPLLAECKYVRCQSSHLLKTAAIASRSFVLEWLYWRHRVPTLTDLVFHLQLKHSPSILAFWDVSSLLLDCIDWKILIIADANRAEVSVWRHVSLRSPTACVHTKQTIEKSSSIHENFS